MKRSRKYNISQVAVDIVIFTVQDDKLQTLLIQIKKRPLLNKWAFPGGLINFNESLDKAAQRELKEKTGLKNVFLEQLYSFGAVKRDPFSRVISAAYFALVPPDSWKLKTTDKYQDIKWWPMSKLPSLAYDHNLMAKIASQRLRTKLTYTNIVWSILPQYFSLSELQKVYEIILSRQLDKRNFRKKILSSGFLKKALRMARGAHRPAQLYVFKSRKLTNIELI